MFFRINGEVEMLRELFVLLLSCCLFACGGSDNGTTSGGEAGAAGEARAGGEAGAEWRCDGEADCADDSDEVDCPDALEV